MLFDSSPTGVDRKVRIFTLAPSFVESFSSKPVAWGPLGEFTFRRTYSRTKPDGSSEEWFETCQRVVEGVYNIQKLHCRSMGLPWNESKSQKSAQEMYQRIFDFKFTPPGRGLWMMGTDQVLEKGSASLQNCSFVSSKDIAEDFASPFCFLMDVSMLGVGCGGDTRGSGKVKLQVPKMDPSNQSYVIPDTREGWVELVRVILNSFVGKGSCPSVIDFSKIRARGTVIKGFGGVASGPEPLKQLVRSLVRLLLPQGVFCAFAEATPTTEKMSLCLNGDGAPYKISSSQIVDIFNFVGKCVVAGNLRRSAELMLGDITDQDFLSLKDSKKLEELYACKKALGDASVPGTELLLQEVESQIEQHPLLDRRWASNNSIYGRVGMEYSSIVPKIASNGEPGIFWLENAQQFGRMGDPQNTDDCRILGANPCVEIALESFEFCNLVETFPAHHETLSDYLRTLKFAYLYSKTVTLIPSHDPRSNAVAMRNRRIGCSMSGITQAIAKFGFREFLSWCDKGYEYIQGQDKIYSEWLCIPRSVKTTAVKPSGTVSLLCQATPGVHFPHSEYYIRRIRVAGTSDLVQQAREAGHIVEKDKYSDDTWCIEFPIHEKNFLKSKTDVSIWEQFALAAALQKHWADNMVSISVHFKESEKNQIQTCLEAYEDQLKSISLLPLEDHGYVQAPYETITKEQYEEMSKDIKPINYNSSSSTHDISAEEKFCTNDTCTISFGSSAS